MAGGGGERQGSQNETVMEIVKNPERDIWHRERGGGVRVREI